ncbi:MAG: hypothetical protein A2Y17_02005 [Clostridiales bacterium GWF2_38_85]|nr:MAG: hypothetical protein A2Y17_02005 [Clostridiales bacterium GWF2_38_85]HBL85146.1 hypothetical protein [Clostridiales bacterium]
MKKIGFIDHYLDEWHANNYPDMIKKVAGDELVVAYAYAEINSPKGGMTTDQWCEKFGVQRINTIEELVEKSDCLIVLSPDNPERHLDLTRLPLASGKCTYVDKTFATTKAIAEEIVANAEKHNTPFFSTSALRFANEMKNIRKDGVTFINSKGPGVFEIYTIHQLEPIVMLMGSQAERVMAIGSKEAPALLIEFAGNRRAVLSLFNDWRVSFGLNIAYDDGKFEVIGDMTSYFDNFIVEMCDFFKTGNVKADPKETIAIMGIIESGAKAMKKPLEWVNI